jgi:phosphatidate cytidylyltransferase
LLSWRILLGTVFIAALAGLVWLDFVTTPGAWLLPLALVLALASAHEVVTLLDHAGYRPLSGIIYGGSLLVVASNAIGLFWLPASDDQPIERLGWPLIAFALVFLTTLLSEVSRYRQPGGVIVNVGLATFGVAYVGVLLSFAVQLRVLGGPVMGMVGLVALIAVVKLGDIGAYTVGRLFGRHKMSPLVSPGKTIEGACGGLAFCCTGAWLVFQYLPPLLGGHRSQHAWSWLAFGLLVGGAGILGDLAESLFKRDMGAKDSSAWLRGFGGVLDLVDSILFAAPVAYLCMLLEIT